MLRRMFHRARSDAARDWRLWGARIAGPGFLAILFLALTAISWRKWPDFLTDFGRELYTPWQLASGRVLYVDVASLFGPFSQYWNALWFKALGVSITTLVLSNLLILAVLIWLLYDLFTKACDRLTATVACAAFLTVFAFSHYLPTGNYNFVTPYSHEATHGVVLATAMVWCLTRYAGQGSLYLSGLAGAFLGLIFLTKPEVFAAAASAAAVAFALLWLSKPVTRHRVREPLLSFAAAFLIPIALFLTYFSFRMPLAKALRATAGAWIPVITTRPSSSPFFRLVSGLDDPAGYGWDLLKTLTWLAVSFSAAVLLDWSLRRQRKYHTLIGAGLAATLAVLASIRPRFWDDLGLTLPLLSLSIGGWLIVQFFKHRHDPHLVRRHFPLVIWSVFSLVLLAKTILNTRLFHYGFFLAFPSTLLLISALVHLVPRALSIRWNGGAIYRAFAVTLVFFLIVIHFYQSLAGYRLKTAIAGRGADALRIYDPDVKTSSFAILRSLERIEALMAPEATLAVLPEGVMFNYLGRRRNPTPYIVFMPPELDAFGEERVLAALKEQPPDYIMLIHKDTRSEYGVGPFGSDPRYGRRIMGWVRANYRSVETILNEPLKDDRFGIEILARFVAPIASQTPSIGSLRLAD